MSLMSSGAAAQNIILPAWLFTHASSCIHISGEGRPVVRIDEPNDKSRTLHPAAQMDGKKETTIEREREREIECFLSFPVDKGSHKIHRGGFRQALVFLNVSLLHKSSKNSPNRSSYFSLCMLYIIRAMGLDYMGSGGRARTPGYRKGNLV